MESEADAGDAAAGDLVGGKGLAVFIGEVDEAMGLGGLFQPVDEGFHLGAEVKEEVHDCVAGCGFDFLHGMCEC